MNFVPNCDGSDRSSRLHRSMLQFHAWYPWLVSLLVNNEDNLTTAVFWLQSPPWGGASIQWQGPLASWSSKFLLTKRHTVPEPPCSDLSPEQQHGRTPAHRGCFLMYPQVLLSVFLIAKQESQPVEEPLPGSAVGLAMCYGGTFFVITLSLKIQTWHMFFISQEF